MSLIDNTYFIRDIALDAGTYSNLASSITKYERQLMYELFNYTNAEKVLNYTPGSDIGDQWVIDVVDGKEYTVDDVTYKWSGLVNTELDSLIAYYVYFWHLTNISTLTGGTGVTRPKHENSDTWNAGQKVGAAWVKFENLLYELNMMLSNEHETIEMATNLGNVNMFDF